MQTYQQNLGVVGLPNCLDVQQERRLKIQFGER